MKRLARKATSAVQACGRLLVVGGIFAVGCLYLSFGTVRPCGILREAIRRHDDFAAILPDGLINFALESQYGPMSDNQCFSVLLHQIIRVEPPSLRLELSVPRVHRENFVAPKSHGGRRTRCEYGWRSFAAAPQLSLTAALSSRIQTFSAVSSKWIILVFLIPLVPASSDPER